MSERNEPPPDEAELPEDVTARVHALWDELADFGAHETEEALVCALQTIGELTRAQNAFWIGAVRVGGEPDPLGGWRLRAMRRWRSTPEDDRVSRLARQRFDRGIADPVTLAQTRQAGAFRSRLMRELAPPGFSSTPEYDLLYRSRQINDAIFAAFPVNEDAESYFGWYRAGSLHREPFSELERDIVSYALRALKWFHRQVMLFHGLLVADAPLTPVERRLVSLLLTELSEKEIAQELRLAVATTHTYITSLFRKFGVSGRPGLTALWLGSSRSEIPPPDATG
jgi:DNA-binding CsgD family transcriptional regulator